MRGGCLGMLISGGTARRLPIAVRGEIWEIALEHRCLVLSNKPQHELEDRLAQRLDERVAALVRQSEIIECWSLSVHTLDDSRRLRARADAENAIIRGQIAALRRCGAPVAPLTAYSVPLLPLWTTLGGVVLALRTAEMIRTRRRLRSGCCRTCGYDLRASRDRCPECGEPVGRGPGVAR